MTYFDAGRLGHVGAQVLIRLARPCVSIDGLRFVNTLRSKLILWSSASFELRAFGASERPLGQLLPAPTGQLLAQVRVGMRCVGREL